MSELVELLGFDSKDPKSAEDWGFNNAGDHEEIRQAIQAKSGRQIVSGTYEGGLTVTGSAGQYIHLSLIGGQGVGANAIVKLTGVNAIAVGTALIMTSLGSGYETAPTTATASSGTATYVSGNPASITSVRTIPINLPEWQLHPVNWLDWQGFALRHQSAHNEMNAVLGLAGADFESVNFNDKKQSEQWNSKHFNEHLAARTKLGI